LNQLQTKLQDLGSSKTQIQYLIQTEIPQNNQIYNTKKKGTKRFCWCQETLTQDLHRMVITN
jgi:hypothetical protein